MDGETISQQTNRTWQPAGLDEIITRFGFSGLATWSMLLGWILLIAASMYSVLALMPGSWVSASVDSSTIQSFFLFYPPLIIGILLLFWVGFEWGFIPVFLSSFVIAFSASMPVYWALLFAFSFVLGLGIYALAYYCVPVRIDLRDLKSVAFFVVVSLIAAMASSLGSFVWSLQQSLSPAMTMNIWNGWWTGAFFQSVVIIGPLLFLLSPLVLKVKEKYLNQRPKDEVTIGWIYSAIASVVVVVSLFVIGGRFLGSEGINQAIATTDIAVAERVLQATGSFQVIFWISLGIILTVGFTGMYIVSKWNKNLMHEVNEKTSNLQLRERELELAIDERDLLLNEIHGRVKNNLSIILALFELQLKRTGDESLADTLRDSKSRIRSISLIHELMSQAGTFKTMNLKSYVIKLTNRLDQDYRFVKYHSDITVHAADLVLDIERAVPVCMVINEVISRVYERTSSTGEKTSISIDLYTDDQVFYVVVRENGNLPHSFFGWENQEDLGIRLVRSLTKQIKGELLIDDYKNSIAILFPNLINQKRSTITEVIKKVKATHGIEA
jgi:two-component sensor histidine kinase